jgi:hypothetical protein
MVDAKPIRRLEAASVPFQGLQVWTYEDPAKGALGHANLIRSLQGDQAVLGGVLKGKPELKEKAHKFGGFELHSLHAAWDLEKVAERFSGGQALPEDAKSKLVEFSKKLLGEELNVWYGTDGKVLVQVIAKDWAAAKKMLDAYVQGKGTAGEQKAFLASRKELPADATMVMLVNFPGYLGMIADAIKAFVPIPLPIPDIGETQASYLGMSLAIRPERGSVDIYIPGTAVQEVYKAVAPIFKAFGGALGGN